MCPTPYSVQKCYLGQQDHILGHFNPVEQFILSLFKISLVLLSIVLSGTVLCKVCSQNLLCIADIPVCTASPVRLVLLISSAVTL